MATRKPKMIREVIRERAILNQDKRINELEADRDALEIKICRYMESARMYKAENKDLRARCKELEEMLGQTESKLEIEIMNCNEQIKFKDKEIESLKLIKNKPLWKKVFSRG